MGRRTDRLVEAVFRALPANTHREIAETVNLNEGWDIKASHIGVALTHLRRNGDRYHWTVPHVKRGSPLGYFEKGRFFAVLLDKTKATALDEDQHRSLVNGLVSTVSTAASSHRHQAAAMRAAAETTTAPQLKRHLEEYADELAYLHRKGVALLAEIKAA